MATYREPSKILKHFEYAHLQVELQKVCAPFSTLAVTMDKILPHGEEKAACLRKLLEAKDAGVRAIIETL